MFKSSNVSRDNVSREIGRTVVLVVLMGREVLYTDASRKQFPRLQTQSIWGNKTSVHHPLGVVVVVVVVYKFALPNYDGQA